MNSLSSFIHFPLLLLLLRLSASAGANTPHLEALRECGNLYHLDFRSNPNASAVFSNSNCMLICSLGPDTVLENAMNEGFECPLNSTGVSELRTEIHYSHLFIGVSLKIKDVIF